MGQADAEAAGQQAVDGQDWLEEAEVEDGEGQTSVRSSPRWPKATKNMTFKHRSWSLILEGLVASWKLILLKVQKSWIHPNRPESCQKFCLKFAKLFTRKLTMTNMKMAVKKLEALEVKTLKLSTGKLLVSAWSSSSLTKLFHLKLFLDQLEWARLL